MTGIDADAEAARLRFITPGAGQMLEYQATEAEARAYLAEPGPAAEFPFLDAEREALGETATLAAVAREVLVLAGAWRRVGARIKRLRPEAKRRVEEARDAQQVRAAVRVEWSEPVG